MEEFFFCGIVDPAAELAFLRIRKKAAQGQQEGCSRFEHIRFNWSVSGSEQLKHRTSQRCINKNGVLNRTC